MTFNIRFIVSDFLSNHNVGFEILMLLLLMESTFNFQLISKHIIAMLFLPHMTSHNERIKFHCYFVCFLLMMEQNHTYTFNSQTEQDKLHCKESQRVVSRRNTIPQLQFSHHARTYIYTYIYPFIRH